MRKYILLLMFLCLQIVTRGQTGYTCDYWFDNNLQTLQTTTMASGHWLTEVDVSGLMEGLHAIHLQVRNAEGERSATVTRHFVRATDQNAKTGRYWFDGYADKVKPSDMSHGAFSIDVSSLSAGFHTLGYQVADAKGNVSSTVFRPFYKAFMAGEDLCNFWFDDDMGAMQTIKLSEHSALIDVSGLDDGFHILHIQADDGKGVFSSPVNKPFLKVPQVKGVDHLVCLSMVDDEFYKQEEVSAHDGVVEWNVDVKDLSQGIHHFTMQVVSPSGAATGTYQAFFLRAATRDELGEMKCVYAIDGAEFSTEAGVIADGLFHFNLDVSALDDGLHRLTYMLSNGKSVATKVQTQFFMKTPLGGNGIKEYWYWLNDQEENHAQKVVLPERQLHYELISLLPVPSLPIRSSLFEFRVEQGQPVIYAKNDFHLRFYDAANRFTDATQQYVDESVRQEVTDIIPLSRLETNTVDVPGKDEIRWFSFVAEPGDTAAFKASQAIGIQVFSPDGEEVYSAEGSTSVVYGGCHTWKDGTYYVALHDVTGSKPTVSLDFFHLAKYDVVRQDVTVVGNGGCSTVTFEGNGFRDLYAVELYNEQGDSIKHVDISHESDAKTSVTFDFTDAPLGQYHALFHFTTENKTYMNNVTVEEAKEIELATTVSYPSTFLRGSSVTYTVKIENKGNMTAYNVPVYAYIMNRNQEDGISYVKFEGLNLAGLFDELDVDSYDSQERQELIDLAEEIGDDHYFQRIRVENEESPGDSIWARCGYFFINVAPYEARTLRLTIIATENVSAFFSIPNEWVLFSETKETFDSRVYELNRNILKDWYCCYHDKIECYLDVGSIVADVVDFFARVLIPVTGGTSASVAITSKWIGCGLSALSTISSVSSTIFCDRNKSFKDKLGQWGMNGLSLVASILSCRPEEIKGVKIGPKLIKQLFKSNKKLLFRGGIELGDNAAGGYSCLSNPQKETDCPPNSGGGGGSSSPRQSYDPNDIFGYTAESGSKAVKDGKTDLYYTIEFENDPAFATASAHDIWLTDTLDAQKFDLSSFAPTRVKIGEKSAELTGDKNFVVTIDMRPEIYAIAQVEGRYDETKGIAKWHISSLDPMTMEPTDEPMAGVLPVNSNGNGLGEVMFDIVLKPTLTHGAKVTNRAGIVFDTNEAIMTPTWTNVIDRMAPASTISDVQLVNDSTASVTIKASDELSGPWRYDVYVQYGTGAWFLGAENVPVDKAACVKVYKGIDQGFYVVVTDSAGNVEQKAAEREFTLDIFGTLADTDTKVELVQNWNWMSHNQQAALNVDAVKPKAQRILSQTKELVKDDMFGWVGNLAELLPTEMYKVQMSEADAIQLSGRLFFAQYNTIPLYQGWNWVGYPLPRTLAVSEALALMAAEDGDAIIGLDGISEYRNGSWTGTLTEMTPGQGYMYKSASDKRMKLNAAATMSRRKAPSRTACSTLPNCGAVDKHRYPNVMGVVARITGNGLAQRPAPTLVAYCGDECRGVAQLVGDDLQMMNVYGNVGDRITFRAIDTLTGEEVGVTAAEEGDALQTFRSDIIGTLGQPVIFTLGQQTGIRMLEDATGAAMVYDVSGRMVRTGTDPSPFSRRGRGVFVVTGKKGTRKVVR